MLPSVFAVLSLNTVELNSGTDACALSTDTIQSILEKTNEKISRKNKDNNILEVVVLG